MTLDVREDFPVTRTVLESPVTGEKLPLVYMDHAASTQPPRQVLDEHERFLREAYANVHRGAHHLSLVSTEAFEDCRWKIEAFTGARRDHEPVFTSNTTQALNLAAHLVAHEPGVTLVTQLEHHSNDLPHRLRGPVERVKATPEGRVDLEDYERKLKQFKVKLVAVTFASNVTGIMPPVGEMIDLAHRYGAKVLVDGAQALAHAPLDLQSMGDTGGPEFFAAAGHKAYAPFGSAFLLASQEALDAAPPFFPGGGTVRLVEESDVEWTRGVERHEGGTPNVPGVVALGAAIDFLREMGMNNVRKHEVELAHRMYEGLATIPGVRVLGSVPAEERVGVATFVVDGVPHGLVSTILDHEFGIATRNGCFCAHPYLVQLLGFDHSSADALRTRVRDGASTREADFPGGVRASLGAYNDESDVDRFLSALNVIAQKGWKGKYANDGDGWYLATKPDVKSIPAEL